LKYALTAAVALGLLTGAAWAASPGDEARTLVAAEPKAKGVWIAGDNGIVMHEKSGLKCPVGDTDYGAHNQILRLKSISVDDTAGNRATCHFDVVPKANPNGPAMKLAVTSEHKSVASGEPLDRARNAFIAVNPDWKPDTQANAFHQREFGGKYEMKTKVGVFAARVFTYRNEAGGKTMIAHIAAGEIRDWILILQITGSESDTAITTADSALMLSLWSDIGADVLDSAVAQR
jgi:hypothetical protein